ncbi:Uncharacterised protein [Mycobacteroides abscessus]|nr:Uncharacterised protein [Mycobacteroides abscessus]
MYRGGADVECPSAVRSSARRASPSLICGRRASSPPLAPTTGASSA